LFKDLQTDAVIHFAGLKAINESIKQPLRYYDNNVVGSQVLLQAMYQSGLYNLVFSSPATVYGEPVVIPIPETCPLGKPSNPYGRSKQIVEEILVDLAHSEPRWRIAVLRYFNSIGSHESGQIGEDPRGIPTNVLPFIAQVAIGKLTKLEVYGSDYPTPDGTGIRYYIHVMDSAEAHLCALRAFESRRGVSTWNIGTGKGYSVLEVIRAFEATSGRSVPHRISQRRPGDVAICYADPSKANFELGWEAKRNLGEMIRDT
jgi:UDP-glucose 4-epimerase